MFNFWPIFVHICRLFSHHLGHFDLKVHIIFFAGWFRFLLQLRLRGRHHRKLRRSEERQLSGWLQAQVHTVSERTFCDSIFDVFEWHSCLHSHLEVCNISESNVITLTNHSWRKQHNEPIRTKANTRDRRQAWENAREKVTIGFSFTPDWLRKWREFF